jgi:molecular chaperone GrpE (heat shock protein)
VESSQSITSVGLKNELLLGDSMSDDGASAEVVDEELLPQESEGLVDDEVAKEEEPMDPLVEALTRAEKAEKEILYRDAEIQNVRKRMMAEKSTAILYGSLPLARRMLVILADIDRALAIGEDEALALIRTKMWTELCADGVAEIEAKGAAFDPVKMEAITTIPSSEEHPPHTVVEVLEAGFTFRDRVIFASKVVVASE